MEREAATGACARRDRPGQQRIDRNAVGERVKEGREYGQAKRGHERELEGPRAARNVHEQRSQMPEEQDSLARAGLALTRKTRGKCEWNVSAPRLRGTDEELEQDLEAVRPWLQPSDQAPATAEESSQWVAGATRLGEDGLREPGAQAAGKIAHGAVEAGPAAAFHIARCDRDASTLCDLAQQCRNDLWRVLEVGVHDANRLALCGCHPGHDRGGEPGLVQRAPFDYGPRTVSLRGRAQGRSGEAVSAVIDDENLVLEADQGGAQPLVELRDVAGLIASRDDDRELRSPLPHSLTRVDRCTESPVRDRPTDFPHAVPLPIAWGLFLPATARQIRR